MIARTIIDKFQLRNTSGKDWGRHKKCVTDGPNGYYAVELLADSFKRPRVLIADDNSGIHVAITRLLDPSCEVVACVVDGDALFEATERLRPDVVLLDVSLPGEPQGLEKCRRIKATTPDVQVIVFTGWDDDKLRHLAEELGASDFVWKPEAAHSLLPAIERLVKG